jgi:hypothetical protein
MIAKTPHEIFELWFSERIVMNRGQGGLFLRTVTLVLAAGQSVTTVACFHLGTSFEEATRGNGSGVGTYPTLDGKCIPGCRFSASAIKKSNEVCVGFYIEYHALFLAT